MIINSWDDSAANRQVQMLSEWDKPNKYFAELFEVSAGTIRFYRRELRNRHPDLGGYDDARKNNGYHWTRNGMCGGY